MFHSGGTLLFDSRTNFSHFSQIEGNNRSNSGALSASETVEERVEELLLDEGNEKLALSINCKSLDVGLP